MADSFALILTNFVKTLISYFYEFWQFMTIPLFEITIPNWLEKVIDIFTVVNVNIAGSYEVNLLFLCTAFIPIAIILKIYSLLPFVD